MHLVKEKKVGSTFNGQAGRINLTSNQLKPFIGKKATITIDIK